MRTDDYLVEAVYMCVRLGSIEWLGLEDCDFGSDRRTGTESEFSLGEKNHVVCVAGQTPGLSLC